MYTVTAVCLCTAKYFITGSSLAYYKKQDTSAARLETPHIIYSHYFDCWLLTRPEVQNRNAYHTTFYMDQPGSEN